MDASRSTWHGCAARRYCGVTADGVAVKVTSAVREATAIEAACAHVALQSPADCCCSLNRTSSVAGSFKGKRLLHTAAFQCFRSVDGRCPAVPAPLCSQQRRDHPTISSQGSARRIQAVLI